MSDSEIHTKPEIDPAVCRLIEELTERINRKEHVNFQQVLDAHAEYAEQLMEVVPTLMLFQCGRDELKHPERPLWTNSPQVTPSSRSLGDFRLVRQIGSGGMGVVYEAKQVSLDRRVALKVLPFADLLDQRQLQRFKNEARAAAALTHPNIVPVYSVGVDAGIHYYAMQYIDGPTLAQVISQAHFGNPNANSPIERLSSNLNKQLTERYHLTNPDGPPATTDAAHSAPPAPPAIEQATARMFDASALSNSGRRYRTIAAWGKQIADALEYAHSTGVIHRDIKPANLMLDALGNVWITDFGLAQIEFGVSPTITGDIIGTLRYMSPEQAVGEKGLLDQRTDVYSLGVTMHELLTLQPLYKNLDRAALLHKILYEDPPNLRTNCPDVPLDLATIVQKAIEREIGARYKTAGAMADDLRRFLEERPIRAKPPRFIDRLRKWRRRNSRLVWMAAIFSSLTIVGLLAGEFLIDHERQKVRLEKQARVSEERISAAALRGLEVHRYVTQINRADRAFKSGKYSEARELLAECIPRDGAEDFRRFEWQYLWQATHEPDPPFARHEGMAYCVRLSPDGHLLATGGEDGVRISEMGTGKAVAHLIEHRTDVNGIGFSPDGDRLATAGDDRTVRIWSTYDWRQEHVIPHVGNVVAALFVPRRKLLATAERHYTVNGGPWIGEDVVRLWDTETWESRGELQRHEDEIQSMDVSPEGTLIATGSNDGTACIWDLNEHAVRYRWLQSSLNTVTRLSIHCVKFANKSPFLATSSGDGAVRLWSTTNGSPLATLESGDHALEFVTISSDDQLIAAGGYDRSIAVWHWHAAFTARRRRELTFRARSGLWGGMFVDHRRLVTADRDGTINAWNTEKLREYSRIPVENPRVACEDTAVSDIAFSADGRFVISAGTGAFRYEIRDRHRMIVLAEPTRSFDRLVLSSDGTNVVAASKTGDLLQWNAPGWNLRKERKFAGTRIDELWSFAIGNDALVLAREKATRELSTWDDKLDPVEPLAFLRLRSRDTIIVSRQSRYLGVMRASGFLEVWHDERLAWEFENRIPDYRASTMSADGSRLALACEDGTIHLFHTADRNSELQFTADPPIYELALSPDGETLAGFSHQLKFDSVKLWNTSSGRLLLELETSCRQLSRGIFSPDGKTLAAVGINVLSLAEILLWTTTVHNP